MASIFTCKCGIRTTEPFYIHGRVLCTLCAETDSPKIVSSRAAANWREFTQHDRKVPMSSYRSKWETDDDDV